MNNNADKTQKRIKAELINSEHTQNNIWQTTTKIRKTEDSIFPPVGGGKVIKTPKIQRLLGIYHFSRCYYRLPVYQHAVGPGTNHLAGS